MHDNIRTELEWLLEAWWGEGAVDNKVCATGVGFSGVGGNVEGGTLGVDRCFEEDYVTFLELVGLAVEGEFLETCEAGEEGDDAMAAVVTIADGDTVGVEEGEGTVQG